MKQRVTLLLLLAPAVLLLLFGRVPGMTEAFCDPDLAGISYGADDLLRGGTIYENCVETKPPGAYLIFAADFALFGHRLQPVYFTATLLHLLALLLLARLAYRTGGPIAAACTGLFYAALAVDTAAAAGCPNYDTWMMLFAAFAFAALPAGDDRAAHWRFVLSGALLGAAFLMKQQAALFSLAALPWIATLPHGDAKARARNVGLFALGGLAPLALIVLWWASAGGLATMFADLHPGRLGGYLGAGLDEEALRRAGRRAMEHLAGAWPIWTAVVAGLFLWPRSGRQGAAYGRYLLFLAVAVVAVFAGSRFFKHYLIILTAPLALAAGGGIGLIERRLADRAWRWGVYALALLALGFTTRVEMAQAYDTIRDHARGAGAVNFEMLRAYSRDDVNLAERFDDKFIFQPLGTYLRNMSDPDETIYVWPYHPQIYFWAQRRAPTKHYMYFDVAANLPYKHGGWHAAVDDRVRLHRRRLLQDLQRARPAFVVLPRAGDDVWDHAFDELERYVTENYALDPKAPGEHLRVFRLP
ncbi:MAG: glycosyltransferase family 39 protein [Candidatus Lernaella stagnicola]|nr:glycosyltransferase family 39 protein [Candidatus Lernaella stagnicola]